MSLPNSQQLPKKDPSLFGHFLAKAGLCCRVDLEHRELDLHVERSQYVRQSRPLGCYTVCRRLAPWLFGRPPS
jgi:hypothetical protein